MAFWEKLFKRTSKKEEKEIQEKELLSKVQETVSEKTESGAAKSEITKSEITKSEITKSEATKTEATKSETIKSESKKSEMHADTCTKKEKSYSFQFVLTDERMQQRIIEFISPLNDSIQVLNLDLAYGIFEKESNLFLTCISCTNKRDGNTGQPYSTTHFVVLTKDRSFAASFTKDSLTNIGKLTYDVPEGYEEILIQAFAYWRDRENYKKFEKELANQEMKLLRLNSELCNPLREIIAKKEKEKENREKLHLEITSEEDAKQLFAQRNTNYYEKFLKENYDEETIKNFEQYATKEKMKAWVLEECKEILYQIQNGDTDNLYEKLCIVSGRLNFWISASDDDLAELYTRTCKQLWDSNRKVPIGSINSYLSLFTKRFNPLHIVDLLDMTENYLKVNGTEEYESKDLNSDTHKFKEICAKLRGKIAEVSPIENKHEFQFVLTDQKLIAQIVNYYDDKYHDVEAVKESVAYLNCAYGVQNEEVFLTAISEEADSLSSEYSYMYNFVAILLKENQVVEFHCNRNSQNGKFELNYRSVRDFPEILMDAVSFFRNKAERETFFEEYKNTHDGASIKALKRENHDALFTTFPSSYEAELQRIGDNPLGDTLKKLVKLCEDKAHENGFQNTIIYEPVTMEEIEQWEQEHGIKLPESYHHFLCFANGVQLFDVSERIYGLDEIGGAWEHLEADYMAIGEMIGDGMTLCLSKTTGKAYVEDHGKYKEYGDFRDLLEHFIEFLSW